MLNDTNGDVTNFYEVVKTDYNKLSKRIQGTAHSEINHKQANEILKSKKGTKIDRAWAFWIATNMSFGHKMFGGFAFSNTGQASVTANKIEAFTKAYSERLAGVEIFQRDAVNLILLKDGKDSFFYCDPPYVSSNQGHYGGYTEADFTKLISTLAKIKGKFLLSSYPEAVLKTYIKKYKWKHKQIIKRLLVDGKRKEAKQKVECLTWNY